MDRLLGFWDKNINKETEFAAVQELDGRSLEATKTEGRTVYFLNSEDKRGKRFRCLPFEGIS